MAVDRDARAGDRVRTPPEALDVLEPAVEQSAERHGCVRDHLAVVDLGHEAGPGGFRVAQLLDWESAAQVTIPPR